MTSDNLFLGTQISKSEIGTSFSITATNLNTLFTNTTTITTSCTVVGKNSGARITIPLTITKV
jgi:hypothetical protein